MDIDEIRKALKVIEENLTLIAMGQICGQVAHDMRSPLSVVKIFIQRVPLEDSEPDLLILRDVAVRACDRLNTLAEDLLEYCKTGQMQMQRVSCDLDHLIASVCDDMRVLAEQHQIFLDYQASNPCVIRGDETRLARVLQNLIANAIQALSGKPDGKVCVRLGTDENGVVISIRDNGPGFPQEHIDKMFKTGFTTKGRDGNGLGLIYCANVIKAHGGQTRATNQPEGGAEVVISLPYEITH